MSDYFQPTAGSPEGPFRVARGTDVPAFPIADGITIAPVLGRMLNINVVVLEPGSIAETHAHAEEQIGYIVAGRVEFTDGNDVWMLEPGDYYHAPAGAPHGARALDERVIVIDAFAPPRAGVRELLQG